jgi:hypothetical protein
MAGLRFVGTSYCLARLTDAEFPSNRQHLLTPQSLRNIAKEKNFNINILEASNLSPYKAGFFPLLDPPYFSLSRKYYAICKVRHHSGRAF